MRKLATLHVQPRRERGAVGGPAGAVGIEAMIDGEDRQPAAAGLCPVGGDQGQGAGIAAARERDGDRRGGAGVEPAVEDGADDRGEVAQPEHLAWVRA